MKFAVPLLLALGLAACATPRLEKYDSRQAVSIDAPRSAAERAEAVDPALFRIADADTTIYLLGSFEWLPEEYDWRTPAINAAIGASDTLVVAPAPSSDAMVALGLDRDLPPLAQRIDPALRGTLAMIIARSGTAPGAYDLMENWAAALTLSGGRARALGLTDAAGVLPDLRLAFAGKAVITLEPADAALARYDTLPLDAQRQWLETALASPETIKGEFSDQLEAWSRGDLERIEASFNGSLAVGSPLRAALRTAPNRAWAGWIQQRLGQPGTVFVAVGAGHLAGPDSLVAMLEAQRLPVERLR